MFTDINSESIRRLTEAKSIITIIKNRELLRQCSLDSRIYKGSFFVLLYGALEYTITSSVQRSITFLNRHNYDTQNLKTTLYSLVFHNECNAIMDARDKKWSKRYDLFSQINTNKICYIEDSLFPTSNGNIKFEQMESIWKTFGISAEVCTDPKIKRRLSEIADNRNKIAHGRELASTVGALYTTAEIENIYNDISAYCSYITSIFDDYITNEEFLV